jgi:hypothetical protein
MLRIALRAAFLMLLTSFLSVITSEPVQAEEVSSVEDCELCWHRHGPDGSIVEAECRPDQEDGYKECVVLTPDEPPGIWDCIDGYTQCGIHHLAEDDLDQLIGLEDTELVYDTFGRPVASIPECVSRPLSATLRDEDPVLLNMQ